MPEKGAGVSLKDFSSGNVAAQDGGGTEDGAGPERENGRRSDREKPVQTCERSSVPGRHEPTKSAYEQKTGKAGAFPVRPEREVGGSALKGVTGGRKGLVRQFGLLLEQLPDTPVRDAVTAG